MMVRRLRAIGWVLAGALSASGCFGAQARAIPELPPLDVPAPPPRQVEASEPQVLPPATVPGEQIFDPPSRQAQALAPPPQAEVSRPVEPPKPGGPAAEAGTTAPEPPRVMEEPPKAPPAPSTLQTAPAQREVEVERRVRTQLTQASGDLNRVNYQALDPDGRTQYDIAKRFIAQSEDAVRAKNLVFANNLAEKAAALAAQLVSRR